MAFPQIEVLVIISLKYLKTKQTVQKKNNYNNI